MIVLKVTYFTTQEWCSHSSKLVIVYLKLVQVIELYFQRNYNHAYLRLRQELLSVPMSGNRFEPVSSFLFLCCSPVGILMFETWGWGCKRSPHFFTLDNFFAFESFVQKWRVTGRRTFRSDVNGLFHDLTASSTTSRPLTRTYGLFHDLVGSCSNIWNSQTRNINKKAVSGPTFFLFCSLVSELSTTNALPKRLGSSEGNHDTKFHEMVNTFIQIYQGHHPK